MKNPEVIFEDENVLVVNKPAGLMVHHDGRTKDRVLTDWVLENYPEVEGVGEPLIIRNGNNEVSIDRPGIVHRLDKDTTGVMVVAKTQDAHAHLKEQFQNRNTTKKYLAVVWGNIKEDEGIIDQPIGKSKKDFKQWQAGKDARGTMREAETHFSVLRRIEKEGDSFCLLELTPKTGRTHQIRVHMKYLQHPIVSDPLYAGKRPDVLSFKSLALHAWKLSVDVLGKGFMEFEAEIPGEFKALF
jgi:23S rRNA pseudouridine1911/1915/1917 synthase